MTCNLCCSTHPVGNTCDEVLDVKLSGAALLAGGIRTLETPGSFTQCPTLTQGGVLNVIKVVNLA